MNKIDLRIKLYEDEFRCLVSGGVLTLNDKNTTIQICLADIGFDRMDKAIEDVDTGKLSTYSNMVRDL